MTESQWIDGCWQPGQGASWQTYDPCSGDIAWQGQQASMSQLSEAITAAKQGFELWSKTPLLVRIELLQRFSELLIKAKPVFSKTIALETGKPYWEALQEVDAMVNKINLSIRAYHERCVDFEESKDAFRLSLQHKPHGIMAVLGPYNFPGHLPHGHIVPALLAGNSIIFKPSESVPQSSIAMTKLWEQSGLPAGVFNLLQGDGQLGKALAVNPMVKGVLFTGSYQTGEALHRVLAGQVSKLLVLEMGGNNPLIVWDEPDTKATVAQIIVSSFITTGQRCTAARRLILPKKSVYSENLLEALIVASKALSQGKPLAEHEVFMGPLIHADAKKRIQSTLVTWQGLDIKALLAAESTDDATGWMRPGIYVDNGALPDQEVFGPILTIQYADDFSHAISLANHTEYGLAAGIITPSETHWQQFANASTAGVLAWNKPLTGASSRLPFGGTGHSGNMRPSAWYAADYTAYPVASQFSPSLEWPGNIPEKIWTSVFSNN